MKKLLCVCLLLGLSLTGQSTTNVTSAYQKGEVRSDLTNEIIVSKETSIEDLPDRISGNVSNPYFNMWFNEKTTFLPKFQGGKVLKKIVFFGASNGSMRVNVTHGNGEQISKDFPFVEGKNTLDLDWQLQNNVTDFGVAVLSGTVCANKSGVQPELGKIWYRWDRWNDGQNQSWSLGLGIYLEEPYKPYPGEIILAKEASIKDLPDRISGNISNPYFNMWFNEKTTFLPKLQRGKKLKKIVFYGAGNGSVRVNVIHGNGEHISKDFNFVDGRNTLNLDWQLYDNVTDFGVAVLTGTVCANKSGVQPELGEIWYRWDRWNEGQGQNWSLGLGIYLEEMTDKVFPGDIAIAKEATIDDLPDYISGNVSNPYFNMNYSEQATFLPQFQGGKTLKKVVFFGASEGSLRVSVVHGDGELISKDFPFVKGKNTLNLDWNLHKNVASFNVGVLSGTLYANKSGVQPELGKIWYRWDRWNDGQDQNWSLGLGIYLEEGIDREVVVAKEADWSDLPDILSGNPGNPYFNMWFNEKGKFLPLFQDVKRLKRIVFHAAGPGMLRVSCTHGGKTTSEDISFVDGKNRLDLDWLLDKSVTDFNIAVMSGAIRINKSEVQPELGTIWYRWDRWNDGQNRSWNLGLGIYLEDVLPDVPKEGEITPIWIHEYQNSINAPGTQEFYHTLIDNSKYDAIRIGEYLWMDRNLSDFLPSVWAEPWNQGTDWIGVSSRDGITQKLLDQDMDRLFLDKSQFQINIEDFNTYYGRYYSRTEIEHFKRTRGGAVSNRKNLNVYETNKKVEADWKVPMTRDFRQLFSMVTMPDNGVLGQIAVRIGLSSQRNENPLAYDIYDPKGGMNYRTSWFEYSNNELGFNMMPGGSRMHNPGWMSNGLGPIDGGWELEKGEIYHLFHTAKYVTADSQVGIHDNLSTGQAPSWHWYNVRFCRELTPKELGYKLYINKADYEESYEYTILKLNPASVDIKKLDWEVAPPAGYYELPKGYLRGLYINHILDKKNPKSISQIVEYLKKIDDDLFFAPNRTAASNVTSKVVKQESSVVLYPNPVVQNLHIDSDVDEVIKTVDIYTITGFKALSFSNLESKNTLDVGRLSQGVHVVAIETDRGRFTFRIMKN